MTIVCNFQAIVIYVAQIRVRVYHIEYDIYGDIANFENIRYDTSRIQSH